MVAFVSSVISQRVNMQKGLNVFAQEDAATATPPSSRSSSPLSDAPRDVDAFRRVAATMPQWVGASEKQVLARPDALPCKIALANVQVPQQPPAQAHDEEGEDREEMDVSHLSPLDRALMEAVTSGNAEACAQCIAAGGNVNLTTSGGKALIFYALMRAKDAKITIMLLEAGATVDPVDSTGNTVMHLWARATRARDDLIIIGKALIAAGADMNAQRDDGMSPLHLLVAGNNNHRGWADYHKASFLLAHGARADVPSPDGRLPLHMLKSNRRAATVCFEKLLNCKNCFEPRPICHTKDCAWCSTCDVFAL